MGLQTFTVEYRVSGLLDGVTPSPPLSAARVLSNGIYQFSVDNLGLIDPSYDGEVGSMGDRFMTDLIIKSPNAPVGGLVAIVSDGLLYDTVYQTTDALSQFVNCVPIPQGDRVSLDGFDAGVSPTPIVVRMQFRAASDNATYASLVNSCCCCTNPPVITDVTWANDPSCILCEDTEGDRTVTVTGSNFSPTATVEIFNTSTSGLCELTLASIGSVTVVSSTEITFVVSCDGGPTPSDCPFGIRITNSQGCTAELVDAFCISSNV